MSNDRESGGGAFHAVQPLRDLESNWAVDLTKNLEEYLLKICSGDDVEAEDTTRLFTEAALLLQGSVQVYSRKVEYLYSLVLHALEFISQTKRHQDQPETSEQPEESGSGVAPDEADDSFWGLDDIPVDPKNSLDSANCRDTPLNYFVKAPANLVVLEGDCIDASGESGELESYLLATNDLYRDFILLDSCDAAAVDDFLNGEAKFSKENNGSGKGSSLTKSRKESFLSPSNRCGGSGRKLSAGKNQDSSLKQSPLLNNISPPQPATNVPEPVTIVPEDDDYGFDMGDRYSDDDELEDDPWKPLNPHEQGTLKVKPFKRVKARKEKTVSCKRIPITKEFPLAKLHGTISSELNEIWETQRRVIETSQETQPPPLYEKLRQSLVLGSDANYCGFSNGKGDNQDNGYDSGGHDFGTDELDVPEFNEGPFDHEERDGPSSYGANEEPGSQDNLEDLCRSHLDSLLASIAETDKQSALAARVSTWKQKIEQNMEEQDSRPPFDIHEYGQRVLDKLSLGADVGNTMSFTDVVSGQQQHDVARTFSALLQLVNNGNVELEKGRNGGEFTCYTASNPFHVRLLCPHKSREVRLKPSKKRAKSPLTKGKENEHVVGSASPSASTSNGIHSPQTIGKFSIKVGKVGGLRRTPESKRRRRSRLADAVDLNTSGLQTCKTRSISYQLT